MELTNLFTPLYSLEEQLSKLFCCCIPMAELQSKCVPVPMAFDLYEPENSQKTKDDQAPIILLHGLFMNRTAYRSLGKELCNETKRAVYIVDLRNHGESPYPEETGIMEMAEDIFAFIQEKQLKKVVFVCHSFSSRAAVIVAITRPTVEVEKMIHIDFAPYWADQLMMKTHNQSHEYYNRFFQKLPFETPLDVIDELYFTFHCGKKMGSDMKKLGARFVGRKGTTVDVYADREKIHEAATIGKFDYKARDTYHGPVMFVKAANSNFWDDETIALHAKYFPNSKFIIISDATHMLPFEKPEEFIAEAKKFLKSDS